ncbi:tetrapyrrole methylase family protein/MazG family protein [Clostridium saccharoperbutylacetonicum]|jgi:tetrapyrrole methylase family protein/MazG family protein|uniref:MazG family protein n=1 Tax=Clostridium saccharoperbutylacetonicum N1-4(HMT) TaxID=931276 RepID=M1MBX8_9CLOT|nr:MULTISPECIES: nucleoside triphosphate pyrophosphohydrolase [Clostridium]AGF53948.1 MazG family protein [Clostridium saccharoperbutylacetonicum N1-4(HMT)]NRT59539.1 tetrapyrrole methylase family protein/MazG family protein [Clostridium saccharoperbutylacetonicum]NSB28731.1 tetrapyrrole methylase family protein/MazG family protein [Clostridium saccharoperbutylacetonicum]NSB42222.1 tetrapyrrole methylase family protein/MazG family protein [Clostridium saccharoperbutylacetonicum]
MIKIVGLGPGDKDALTIGTVYEFENTKNIFLRTEKHPTVDYLIEKGIKFETYDNVYENTENFDEVYLNIANDLLVKHNSLGDLIYGVPGHPLVAEKSVFNLIELCKENNVEYKIIPAVSFIDAMIESIKIDPIEGLKVIDAFDIGNQILDKRIGTIITQVYNQLIASEVKLKLLDQYNDETDIYYVRAAGIKGQESIRKIPLFELDMQEDIDYLTSVYIPKDMNNKKDFNDLLDIIEILRGENGCPWDREQTHESLKKSLVEESYEVIDAIDQADDDSLIEELGDVLLQVVFHASIGKEDGYFDINDVIGAICDKMISRHPHVFKRSSELNSSEEVLVKWDDLKKKEKGYNTITEEMNGITKGLPALLRAHKVQEKAKKVGFDFEDISFAINKVKEELKEVIDVYNTENVEKITEEVGDLLFSCVNVARFLKVDEEVALNYTIDKFIKRFAYIESVAKEKNIELTNTSLDEMDKLWEISKKID